MLFHTTIAVLASCSSTLALHIWDTPGDLPSSIPASCRVSLSQNITCAPELVYARAITAGRPFYPDFLKAYCTSECSNSIQTFQRNVNGRCRAKEYDLGNNATLSSSSLADSLAWAYNVTCVSDDSGFCFPGLANGKYDVCSKCALRYESELLKSKYGEKFIDLDSFSSILSSCGSASSEFPHSTPTNLPASTSPSSSSASPTCDSKTYKVGASDTCQSIADANSIALDRLVTDNGLDHNCNSLKPGRTLCLGKSCKLHTVSSDDTCSRILKGKGFGQVQLTSWNPTLHFNCDNLQSMAGRTICISPPGTDEWQISTMSSSSSSISPMFSDYVAGTAMPGGDLQEPLMYAPTDYAPVPTTTAKPFSQDDIDAYAERVKYCPITDEDIARGITISDLPEACEAILEPYCNPDFDEPAPTSTRFPHVCTPERPPATSTTSSANPTSTAVSPILPGTVDYCKSYYQITTDGETCYGIEQRFDITDNDFMAWNTAVGADCSGLRVGYYVCVKA